MTGRVFVFPVGVVAVVAVSVGGALISRSRTAVAAHRIRSRLRPYTRGEHRLGRPRVGSSPRTHRRARGWGLPVPSIVIRAVHDLAIDTAPETAFVLWCALALVMVAGGMLVGGAILAGAAGIMALVGPVVVGVIGRGRRVRLVDRQLPDALDRMARSVRAGGSLAAAFASVASDTVEPLASELAVLESALLAGQRLNVALERWRHRCPTPGVNLVVAAATLGHEAGGSQARALDAVASTLRERQAVRREARALASQSRASAAVIVLAPLFFAVFSAATDPAVLRFLVGTPTGVACLTAALALDAAGAAWMARLTRGVG